MAVSIWIAILGLAMCSAYNISVCFHEMCDPAAHDLRERQRGMGAVASLIFVPILVVGALIH